MSTSCACVRVDKSRVSLVLCINTPQSQKLLINLDLIRLVQWWNSERLSSDN